MTICYFCIRPSAGMVGYEEGGCGMRVPHCTKHYEVALDLVYGNVLRRLEKKRAAKPGGTGVRGEG